MKFFDKKYIKIGTLAVICTCICISFYFLIKNGAESLFYIKDKAVSTMLPFIDGIVIAFILNPIMKSIEKRMVEPLMGKVKAIKPSKSLNRGISIFFTLLIFLFILIGLIALIVPQVISSIQSIISRMPYYLASLNRLLSDLVQNNDEIEALFNTYSKRIQDYINSDIIPYIQSFVSSLSGMVFSSVFVFFSGALKFIIGIIIFCSKRKYIWARLKK